MIRASEALPNVIFILGDDIGYGDFGCYGATKIKTPNVDALAREGLRFTDAHSSAATCTPTRYALMTGQYAFRNPMGSHILPGDAPLSIKPVTLTLPGVFKKAGYATGIVGKWHLGLGDAEGQQNWNGEIKPGPLEVGFDFSFIIPATGDRVPCVFVEGHRVINLDPADPIKVDYKNCLPGHANMVQGIGRIGAMTGGKQALWKDDEIASTLTGEAVKFIRENQKRPFFLYLATHDIHVPRMPAKKFRGASQAGIRGDAVEQFDGCVGEILKTLNDLKLAQNTLVMVGSDNGGILDFGDTVERDGDEKSNNGHAFNGVLRGTKGTPYEGGTRVPFIAKWLGKIKPGTSDELICSIDLLATCATLVGQELPPEAAPDSFNMFPVLRGKKLAKPVRDHLVEDSRRKAIRQGFWKYISPGKGKGAKSENSQAELYNLEKDISEKHNLANSEPGKTKELAALLERVMQESRTRLE
ncbi:MAG: arylsulfatase [Verrucomicrobiota bacterium]